MKTVLLVGNVFEPCRYWAVEQRRWDGFRRYLPAFGWRPVILVKACNCGIGSSEDVDAFRVAWSEDPVAAAARIGRTVGDWPADKPVVVILECAATGWLKSWLKLALASGYRFARDEDRREVFHLLHPLPVLDTGNAAWRFALPATKALGLIVGRVHEQARIDWVSRATAFGRTFGESVGMHVAVGSYPSIHNPVIARSVARALAIPWVADFRDSICRGWSGPAGDAARVRRLLGDCATTVYVTPQEADRDAALHGCARRVVENGFAETEDFINRRDWHEGQRNGKLTLRYLGTVYPTGHIDVFLDALAQLVRQEHPMVDELLFEYVGPSADVVAASVSSRGIEGVVSIRDSVPFAEAQELMLQSDALVMRTNSEGLHGAPGAKFYEYLGCRKPVLAAGFKDRYVVDVLERTGAGRACDVPEDVTRTLDAWWQQWCAKGRIDLPMLEEEILKHSRKERARALAGVLDEMETVEDDHVT